MFTESAPRPIQSMSRNVRQSVVLCVSSPMAGNHVDWRLLVEERITKVAKQRNLISFRLMIFSVEYFFWGG